jgi:6-phosphofructokinase
MKTIGLVTSGGDAPGMNAAIRAVVRLASAMGFEVLGFERGWEGLIKNTFRPLNAAFRRRNHTIGRAQYSLRPDALSLGGGRESKGLLRLLP